MGITFPTGAHRSEGIFQALEPLWFPKLGSKERAEPPSARESDYQEERLQEKAKRGERQKWREGKTSPPSGLWVLKLNDQRGLEREKMRK